MILYKTDILMLILLASTEEELKKTRKERDDIRREKDEIIAELQFKIDHMESAYESVLHVCTTLTNLRMMYYSVMIQANSEKEIPSAPIRSRT